MERNIFKNISPLDHRYSLKEDEFNSYQKYFSEKAKVKYQAKVEEALVKTLAERGICSKKVANEVKEAVSEITVEEVYNEEKKTKHNIRALVNCIQKKLSSEAKPYVHFTTTSFDIVDTANALRLKEATNNLLLPVLKNLEKNLIEIADREKETIQIGRTHGQAAVPITFGFTIAEYVSRLGERIEVIKNSADKLKGKISGAVGAYNASSLFFEDPEEFERQVLSNLDLSPGEYSTQIVMPEVVTDFVHNIISAFGVLANFSDDMRHLQRSEISEVGEHFSENQVGSSTMPHKRNPINYENVKSMWKKFMPQMITVYQDQISEHQRDLSNSASSRFIPEIIVGLLSSANRLIRVTDKLVVDKDNIKENFAEYKEMVVAEPLYILLASYGHPDAHEAVRKLTLKAEKSGKPLRKLVKEEEDLEKYLDKFNNKQWEILLNPEKYIGISVHKTEKIIERWSQELNL